MFCSLSAGTRLVRVSLGRQFHTAQSLWMSNPDDRRGGPQNDPGPDEDKGNDIGEQAPFGQPEEVVIEDNASDSGDSATSGEYNVSDSGSGNDSDGSGTWV